MYTPLDSSVVLVTLGHDREPIRSILAPFRMLSGPRSRKDDPTALLTVRCLLRVAATISTTTAARAMAHRAFALLGTTTNNNNNDDSIDTGYMDKLLVLEHGIDASNRVVARAFVNSPSNPQQSGRRQCGSILVSEVVDSKLSRRHQERAICGRTAQLQGPAVRWRKNSCFRCCTRERWIDYVSFVPTDIPMKTFTVAPTFRELQK